MNEPRATFPSTALARYEGQSFVARKKVLKIFGGAFYVFEPDEQTLRFYVKQKAFKLKEAITVFTDETMQQELLKIQARQILDISATYDVTTTEGEKVGALRRKGLKSILRDEWEILDADDGVIGKIQEDSIFMALLRRLLSNLIPQTFHLTIDEQSVALFKQRFNPFIAKIDIDFSMDTAGLLDRRLGIAAVVLLLSIEGRQK